MGNNLSFLINSHHSLIKCCAQSCTGAFFKMFKYFQTLWIKCCNAIQLGAGLVQALELFIEEFSEIPMERMNGKKIWKLSTHCCALLSLSLRLKKEEVRKTIHVRQVPPASMFAIIIFCKSAHYSLFFKLVCLLCVYRVLFTWTELLDSSIAAVNVDRQEVFEPGDLRVGVPAGGTEHGSSSRSLHHLQLRAHVYGGEAVRDLVLWKTHTHTKPQRERHQHTWLNCTISCASSVGKKHHGSFF